MAFWGYTTILMFLVLTAVSVRPMFCLRSISLDHSNGGLSSPQLVTIGGQLSYALTQEQINFILARMAVGGYLVDQVRIGLAARSESLPLGDLDQNGVIHFNLQSAFEIAAVPEPGTLLLLGSGMVALDCGG